MKLLLILALSIATHFCFSQIEEEPKKYSKIIYEYQKTSTTRFTDNGIYMDTLLIKNLFLNKKYEKNLSPIDSVYVVGFIANENITNEDKKIIRKLIFEDFSKTKVTFDVEKKTSYFEKTQGNEALYNEAIKELLDHNYKDKPVGKYMLIYKNNNTLTQIERVFSETLQTEKNISRTQNYSDNIIEWIEPNFYGTIKHNYYLEDYISTVVVNKQLNKYIVPTILFANCDYGIEKVYSIRFNLELISVKYE